MKYKLVCAIIWFVLTISAVAAELCNLNPPSWLDLGFAYCIMGFEFLNSYFDNNWRLKK